MALALLRFGSAFETSVNVPGILDGGTLGGLGGSLCRVDSRDFWEDSNDG